MPMGSSLPYGNTKAQWQLGLSVSTPSVLANTSATQTYNVPGLLINDLCDPVPQSHVAGLSIAAGWAAANGVLTLQFVNSTTGTIGVQTGYKVIVGVTRSDADSLGFSSLPSAIQ